MLLLLRGCSRQQKECYELKTVLLGIGLELVTRPKAGENTASWIHQQGAQLCNPSKVTPKRVFIGFALTRETDGSQWDLHQCCCHLNTVQQAFRELAIILGVRNEEYEIFQTSKILNTGGNVLFETAHNGSHKKTS